MNESDSVNPIFLRESEVAALFQVSVWSIRRWRKLKHNPLPCCCTNVEGASRTSRTTTRYYAPDVVAWFRSQKGGAA